MSNAGSLIAARLSVPTYAVPERKRAWMRKLAVVVAASLLGICAAKMRSLDPVVKTDPVTGCQYLQFGVFGSQAIPRLGRSGKPICQGAPAGPIRHRI